MKRNCLENVVAALPSDKQEKSSCGTTHQISRKPQTEQAVPLSEALVQVSTRPSNHHRMQTTGSTDAGYGMMQNWSTLRVRSKAFKSGSCNDTQRACSVDPTLLGASHLEKTASTGSSCRELGTNADRIYSRATSLSLSRSSSSRPLSASISFRSTS